MICRRCGGVLFADRDSVAELAHQGFRGGRIRCMAGCTSIWLVEGQPDTGDQRCAPRSIECVRCHQPTTTFAQNGKYCARCTAESRREAARKRWHRRAA